MEALGPGWGQALAVGSSGRGSFCVVSTGIVCSAEHPLQRPSLVLIHKTKQSGADLEGDFLSRLSPRWMAPVGRGCGFNTGPWCHPQSDSATRAASQCALLPILQDVDSTGPKPRTARAETEGEPERRQGCRAATHPRGLAVQLSFPFP